MTPTADLMRLVAELRESITDWGDNMRNETMADLLAGVDRIESALASQPISDGARGLVAKWHEDAAAAGWLSKEGLAIAVCADELEALTATGEARVGGEVMLFLRKLGLAGLQELPGWPGGYDLSTCDIERMIENGYLLRDFYEWIGEPATPAQPQASEAKDAGRYRWLRDYNTQRHPDVTYAFYLGAENLDAAIDAAMTATLTAPGADDGQ